MAGYPDWFNVTDLEIVAAGGSTGDAKQDVIEIGPSADPARNALRLIVTFEGPNTNVAPHFSNLGFAEWESDNALTPPIPATAEFWAESIGPASAEVLIGSADVILTVGGDPGGHPTVDTSLYRAQLDVANADTVFVDPAAVLQPGLYRIGCAVKISWTMLGTPQNYDAFFDGDLLIRVVERGP